jgi:hypothetical protein
MIRMVAAMREVEFCIEGCEDRRECEAEEFPQLETVARPRLVKTQHTGNT